MSSRTLPAYSKDGALWRPEYISSRLRNEWGLRHCFEPLGHYCAFKNQKPYSGDKKMDLFLPLLRVTR